MKWTWGDESRAEQEDWFLTEEGSILSFCPTVEADEKARDHTIAKAAEGSEFHQRALAEATRRRMAW